MICPSNFEPWIHLNFANFMEENHKLTNKRNYAIMIIPFKIKKVPMFSFDMLTVISCKLGLNEFRSNLNAHKISQIKFY